MGRWSTDCRRKFSQVVFEIGDAAQRSFHSASLYGLPNLNRYSREFMKPLTMVR